MSRNREWHRWSMKVALASTIARACRLPGLDALAPLAQAADSWLSPRRRDFAVGGRTEMPSMLISAAMFERHLDGSDATSASSASTRSARTRSLASRSTSRSPPSPSTMATATSTSTRYPSLKRKGIPAAVFVVTDLVGRDCWQMHDKLYHLLAKAFARWDDPRRELLRPVGRPRDHADDICSRRAQQPAARS